MSASAEKRTLKNYTLRPPRASDYEVIASWITDSGTCQRWAGPRVSFPFSANDLPTRLLHPGIESYCLSDGLVATYGFGQFWVVTPGAVHLGRLIISPELRGQGFGRKLCQQLMKKAVQRTGARKITLRVYRDNTPAVALYLNLGFVPVRSESTDEILFMEAAVNGQLLFLIASEQQPGCAGKQQEETDTRPVGQGQTEEDPLLVRAEPGHHEH